jgi:hypothetical protein
MRRKTILVITAVLLISFLCVFSAWSQSNDGENTYTVTITTKTVARTMYPLHACINKITIELDGNRYAVNNIDIARRNLPSFAEQTAMNTIKFSVSGSWYITAQLNENGIIQMEVENSNGTVVKRLEDSGFGAIVALQSSQVY